MNTSKIIKAYIRDGTYSTTEPITQGDYGYILQIEGVVLPSVYRVDFSNDRHKGEALPVYGNENGVEVPEELIATGKDIFAFYFYLEEGFGKTAYTWKIPNDTRAQNGNRVPTPTQQDSIDQLVVRSNEAVERAEQSASDADASERMALRYAESAQESARQAQEYSTVAISNANSASQSASQASASATASAQSASQSAQIKDDVEGMVDDAQGYVESASKSASASAQSASQASGYAQSASASAQSASGYASSAQTSAQTASTKASEASTSASTASTKASESAQSASQALTYKTDAESAKTASQTAQGLAESARDSAISAKEDAEDARDEAQNIVDGISGKVEQIDQNTDRIESLEDDRYKPYPTDTASGAVASFSDGADNIPLKSLIVNIDPVQYTSSGDPSPENICPISGWTGANVTATNTNLRGGIDLANDIKARIPSATIDTEEKTVSWGYNATHNAVYAPKVPFKENTRYTFILTVQNASKRLNFRIYYTDGSMQALPDLTTTGKETVVIVTSANKTVLTIVRQAQGGTTKLYYDESGIFEGVLTASDFQPFGQTIPISWQTEAGTVYGGKLDVLSGVLTVDRAMTTFDGSENWTPQNGVFALYLGDAANIYKAGTTSQQNIIIADRFKPNGVKYRDGCGDGNIIKVVGNNTQIACYSSVYSSVDAFKSSLDDNPMQIVYVLATPIEIQLDAHTVKSLLGANNIFADTGDTEVEYRADTKLYIERLTAPDSADMIADANIVSGSYFMVGNSLYKATANIANGGQIVVGTNCTRVSLARALNEINA